MTDNAADDTETTSPRYVIPARTISGSVPELLEELDDMMDALHLVREEVVRRAAKPATKGPTMAQRWSARITGLGAVLLTLGVGFAVDGARPFVTIGTALGIVGLVCLLVPGWFEFGSGSRW